MSDVEREMRSMIADRLTEYQDARARARMHLDMSQDPSCDCDPEECGMPSVASEGTTKIAGAW